MAKIGDGTLAAMGRLGLKELRNAFNPSRDSIADTELGMYGTATQGEIAEARGDGRDATEGQPMTLNDLRSSAREQTREQDRGLDGPEQDRGMER